MARRTPRQSLCCRGTCGKVGGSISAGSLDQPHGCTSLRRVCWGPRREGRAPRPSPSASLWRLRPPATGDPAQLGSPAGQGLGPLSPNIRNQLLGPLCIFHHRHEQAPRVPPTPTPSPTLWLLHMGLSTTARQDKAHSRAAPPRHLCEAPVAVLSSRRPSSSPCPAPQCTVQTQCPALISQSEEPAAFMPGRARGVGAPG